VTRPSFKIDPKRLRDMRKELDLTQREVAKRVHEILGKSAQTADTTLVTTYQRIERTGDTSQARAVALAKVLGTTVAILQGGDVPEDSADFVSRIEQQIREQKESGNNPALEHALDQRIKRYDSPIDEDDCIRGLAMAIGKQIEVAQIGRNSIEIARLAALTGWSEAQLRQPGGVHGHWLLLTTVHGSRETEIVLGVSEVMYRIRDTFEKWEKWHESDVRVTLNRSLPWFHVDIVHPRTPVMRCKFSFVRCQPEVSGLKWVNPHWRDTFWLEDPLKEWAFSKANLFTDFDGKGRPDDVRQLRFRVLERDDKSAFHRVAYSKGYLDELPEEVFQNFKAEGNSHFIVTNWLASGLERSLAPLLTAYPRECWTIRAGTCHIAILLELPYRLWRTNSDPLNCNGIRYSIDLVEETSPGVYRSAPWRDSSVTDVTRLLEERVFEHRDDIDGEETLQFLSLPDSPH
jgi:transcriptional regulator with XRE-family HTH domain